MVSLVHLQLRAFNIEDYYIRGDGCGPYIWNKLPLCVRNLYILKLYKMNRAECTWKFVLPSVMYTSS